MKYKTFLKPETLSSSEEESDYILSDLSKMSTNKGYSVWSAAVFITSFMAGMGVLAVPHALAGTGWYGMILITIACINGWYSAVLLGRTWNILEERWEEYRGKFRYPYPAMGQRAVGNWMRYVVATTLHVSLIGIGVVYLLLAAEIAQSMTRWILPLEYGNWIIILAVCLCPLTWFGSIEEFWFAAVGALVTVALACFSLFAAIILEIPKMSSVSYESPSFTSSALAFGTILFSYGGTYIVPTVQNDMSDRRKVHKASLLSFVGLLLLYLPVSTTGYAVLGSKVDANILQSISEGPLRAFIEACLAIHILLAFLIAVNPIAQETEEALGVKPDFNYKRCIIRSFLVGLILLIAYTIPHFDKVLNLIGGSTMTLLTFIFPPLFYLLINKNNTKEKVPDKRNISFLERCFLVQIMIIGIAGGISCTYFATLEIIEVFLNNETNNHIGTIPL